METKVMFVATAIAAAFLFNAINAMAEDRVDERQENQEQRIEKGANSGNLTDNEETRLQKGQARIDTAEAKAEADGVVTRGEKRRLERMQDNQSKKVYQLKHNKRRR